MSKAQIPDNETERQSTLESYQVLNTQGSKELDRITRVAAEICGTSKAVISLVDRDRQWFLSKVGIDIEETHRDISFCAHAILSPEPTLIKDATLDSRFSDNPMVTEGGVRFYAGVPLVASNGYIIGTLCVADNTPRELTAVQTETLTVLARAVMSELERALAMRLLLKQHASLLTTSRVPAELMASIALMKVKISNLQNATTKGAYDYKKVSSGLAGMDQKVDRISEIVSDLKNETTALAIPGNGLKRLA